MGRLAKGRLFAALALVAALHTTAAAQAPSAQTPSSWPNKPVRIIVPVTPGSALDITARVIAERLSAQLGQTFVVENRTGAGGTIGAAYVAKSDPDGYTILIHSAAVTIFPATFANLPFDTARDLAAVTPAVSVPLVLVVSPTRHKSLKDLVSAAKAKPGAINYATVGAGAAAHMTAERLRLSAGFEAQQIPFRGAPEAQTEVVAGRVDFFFSPVLAALPLIKAGQLSALAVSSARRSTSLPDVPTTIEAGYPNSDYEFWLGFFLPAKTPRDIVERLYQEIRKAKDHPEVKAKLAASGGEPMDMTPAEFQDYIRKSVAMNHVLAKAAGIKLQ
ncbi:MAG: tripartite tricarboxylate transporter substrate binding protein [Xanthobacteraceae bacterium]|nr:tripartite tricarboxylate transporter substrate binding protein [Xanthobacteraceae bacterium]